MDDRHLDFIVATSYQNVYYMSDFFSPNSYFSRDHVSMCVFPRDPAKSPVLVLSKSEVELLTTNSCWVKDFICYGEMYLCDMGQAVTEERDTRLRSYLAQKSRPSAVDACLDALKSLGMTASDVVGIDESGVPVQVFYELQEKLGQQMVRAADVICTTRLIKTPQEVFYLRRAVQITEEAIRTSMEQAWVGMTERQLLQCYFKEVVARGGEPMLNCLGFGSHSAHANTQASADIRLEKNQAVRFDIGCTHHHYHADTARAAVLGKLSQKEMDIFCCLRDGIASAIDQIRPGVVFSDVFSNAMCRIKKDLPQYVRSHIGHSVGLEMCEPPMLGENNSVFREGMVLCVEAPYYEIGLGGYQIEEVVHVTADGVEILSGRPVEVMEF